VDAGATSATVYTWVDPVLASGEPSTSTALVTLTDSAGFNFNTVAIKQGPYGNNTQLSEWDEIRLGTSFNSVTNDY
jgi:hypothetical protein